MTTTTNEPIHFEIKEATQAINEHFVSGLVDSKTDETEVKGYLHIHNTCKMVRDLKAAFIKMLEERVVDKSTARAEVMEMLADKNTDFFRGVPDIPGFTEGNVIRFKEGKTGRLTKVEFAVPTMELQSEPGKEIEDIASSSMVKFFIETSDPEDKVNVESWMRLP